MKVFKLSDIKIVLRPEAAVGDRSRVSSPHTFGGYDYGRFSREELRTAGAFRVDEDTGRWP